jgi:hypothetical protein
MSYDRLDRVELKQEGKKKVVYTALEAARFLQKMKFITPCSRKARA